MPTARDYFLKDLQTFINPDEFAVQATIEGETVNVVIDTEKLKERQLANYAEGLHTEELLFHVVKKELSFYPRPDNRVKVDGSHWKVIDVQEDEGLFVITVELISA